MGDPMKCAMVQMQGVFAQLDKSTLVLKLWKARQRIRQEGRQPGAKNYSPDPVQNHVVDGRKPYGHRPGEAAVIERMATMRTGGNFFDAIAEALNAEGVKSRSGGRWYGCTIKNILARAQGSTATASTEGRKPYGHRPGESAIVERILALRQAGAAMDTIAERLNAEGVKPRKGGQWYGPTVRNVLLRSERLQPTA
jgi:hypothetical protein